MNASLRSLLTDLIDYAGLFPPARLPMDQAIRNYARYRQEPEAWMLSRFVCPAARLGELNDLGEELFDAGVPFRFAALARAAEDRAGLLAGLRADLEDIARFRERHGHTVEVDACEVRLPEDAQRAGDAAILAELLDRAASLMRGSGLPSITTVYEPAVSGDWRGSLAAVVEGLAAHNCRRGGAQGEGDPPAGFKLRCGGLDASAVPSSELVAFVLTACRDAGVPFKATAGLHHPIRRLDSELKTRVHGFLNLFGAGVLAHARRLDEGRVRAVLEDERAEDFVFTDDSFRWKDASASAGQIEAARRTALLSFGSCSFDEPREYLQAMRLLGRD